MTEREAESLMKYLNIALANLDEVIRVTEGLSNQEEAQSIRKTVIQGGGMITGDVVSPILSLYPALDPWASKRVPEQPE